MTRILQIFDGSTPHHSVRLLWGLQACGLNVEVIDTKDLSSIEDKLSGTYDYIFFEGSVKARLDYLCKHTNNIIPYDVEDKPYWFSPGEGYQSVKHFARAYAKYNYRDQDPNPDGLKHIAVPQVDYIIKGAQIAKNVFPQRHKIPRTNDVFFCGGPTYLTEYRPNPTACYLWEDDIKSIAIERVKVGNRWVTQAVYNQRMEWVYQLKNSKNIKFEGGLRYENDPTGTHTLSKQYHSKLFGPGCQKLDIPFQNPQEYYTKFLQAPISLSPAGVARSSYRIIELMALGRIIISTDMEGYKYLYNPVSSIEIPDGVDVQLYIESALGREEELLEASIENTEIFAELTPEKMWNDFIKQMPG